MEIKIILFAGEWLNSSREMCTWIPRREKVVVWGYFLSIDTPDNHKPLQAHNVVAKCRLQEYSWVLEKKEAVRFARLPKNKLPMILQSAIIDASSPILKLCFLVSLLWQKDQEIKTEGTVVMELFIDQGKFSSQDCGSFKKNIIQYLFLQLRVW